MSRVFFFVGAFLLSVSAVRAESQIILGNYNLLPNTPGQKISIFVTGGDLVQGVNFNAIIGDGGPELEGVLIGPAITDIDLVTGAIFGINNTGIRDPEALAGFAFKQIEVRETTTNSGSLVADGLLATLTIDTTGFDSGKFPLILSDTPNGPTDFSGIPVRIVDGTITVVPEAGSLVLVGSSVLLVVAASIRRRTMIKS